MCLGGVCHPPAQLLDRIHQVRAIGRQIIGPGRYSSVSCGLGGLEGLFILPFFPSGLVLPGGDDPMRVIEIKLFNDEVGVALISLDLPPCRGATQDSIEEASLSALLDRLSLGSSGCRPGGGA